MNENWYALCIAILNPKQLSIEKAFQKLDTGKITRWGQFTKDDFKDMFKLRHQGTSFNKLGLMYGTTASSIYRMLKRHKEEI